MIIFALLLVLFSGAAFAGWCFGVIRATMTFLGLLVSIILAKIFVHSFTPLFAHVGIVNPILVWMLGPVPVFFIGLFVFKIAGYVIQRKVNLYYKYKAGDLRMGLWNRLNPALGACMGAANGFIYMVLLSMVLYVLSYPAVQLTGGNGDHWSVRLLSEVGRELQSTGLTKVAAAINPMPASYYDASDLAGLIYHNDLLEARLARYPAFIGLGETAEFQQIAANKSFTELRQRQPPIGQIINDPLMQAIVSKPPTLEHIWTLAGTNLDDLHTFLLTGRSAAYDFTNPKYALIGRWTINIPASYSAVLESHTNFTSHEMRTAKTELQLMVTNTTRLIASLENDVWMKNLGTVSYVTNTVTLPAATTPANRGGARGAAPGGRGGAYNFTVNSDRVFGFGRGGGGGGGGGFGGGAPAPAPAPAPAQPRTVTTRSAVVKFDNLQGKWSEAQGGVGYRFQIANRRGVIGLIDGDKLTLVGLNYPLVFDREY